MSENINNILAAHVSAFNSSAAVLFMQLLIKVCLPILWDILSAWKHFTCPSPPNVVLVHCRQQKKSMGKKNWTGIRWDSFNSPYFLDRKKKNWISLKSGGYIQFFMAKDFVEGNQNCAWKCWLALDSVKLILRTMEISFLMVQKCSLGTNYCAHKFSGVQWDIHIQGKKPIGDELLKQLPIWV